MASTTEQVVTLNGDGETGYIHDLTFRSRTLHRQLANVDESQRTAVPLDALDVGAEVLERAGRQGGFKDLSHAVERLDEEAKRIIAKATEQVDRSIEKSIVELGENLQGENGPFAAVLDRFDLTADDNVNDLFRDLVAATAAKATKQAVKDLTEATSPDLSRWPVPGPG